jgi:hypothetical protein
MIMSIESFMRFQRRKPDVTRPTDTIIESSQQLPTTSYKHQPMPTPLVPVLVPVAGVTIWKSSEISGY